MENKLSLLQTELLIIGIALTFFVARQTMLSGIGIGLIAQSSLMLVFDLFAERRGEVYLRVVKTFTILSADHISSFPRKQESSVFDLTTLGPRLRGDDAEDER